MFCNERRRTTFLDGNRSRKFTIIVTRLDDKVTLLRVDASDIQNTTWSNQPNEPIRCLSVGNRYSSSVRWGSFRAFTHTTRSQMHIGVLRCFMRAPCVQHCCSCLRRESSRHGVTGNYGLWAKPALGNGCDQESLADLIPHLSGGQGYPPCN